MDGYDIIESSSPSSPDYRTLEVFKDSSNASGPLNLDYLLCPICKSPFIKPYVTKCGHTFCRDCLESSLTILNYCCPLDQILLIVDTNDNKPPLSIDDQQVFVNPAPLILKTLCDDIKVFCANKPRGCGWAGMRSDVKTHLINDCEYTRILKSDRLIERRVLNEPKDPESNISTNNFCPNRNCGCDWNLEEDDIDNFQEALAKHLTICQYKSVKAKINLLEEKITNLEQGNSNIQRTYHSLLNSIPYLHHNYNYVNSLDNLQNSENSLHLDIDEEDLAAISAIDIKKLIAENVSMSGKINYLMGTISNLGLQINHLSFVIKQQTINNEFQRVYSFQNRVFHERSLSNERLGSDSDLSDGYTSSARVKL